MPIPPVLGFIHLLKCLIITTSTPQKLSSLIFLVAFFPFFLLALFLILISFSNSQLSSADSLQPNRHLRSFFKYLQESYLFPLLLPKHE